jgi:trehalose synthase
MESLLEQYARIVGNEVVDHLRQLAEPLKGMKILHVNSTKEGGGVAEILNRLIPLKQELGIDAEWEIVTGEKDFYQCTKKMHNSLQGNRDDISPSLLKTYEETSARNYERLRDKLLRADLVFIHDPQPAAMISQCSERRNKWLWRCHIDVSRPYRPVWKYLREYIKNYDASIWSLSDFAQPLEQPMYLIPPSILSVRRICLCLRRR